jgi:hypothetical protein
MPLEGHWKRVNTPLRTLGRRERNVVIGAVTVTLVAIVALVIATSGNSKPEPGPGCIYAIIPGVMGAEPVDACGQQARFVCAKHGAENRPGSEVIRDSCERAGVSTDPLPPGTEVPPPRRSSSTGL